MTSNPITTPRRLVHNTVLNVVTLIIEAVIGFFLIPFFLGQLGEAKYGVWMLVGSLFYYRGLMSMGLNSAINRFVPVYLAKGDNEGIERVVSTSVFFFSTLAVVLVLASVVISCNVGNWFAIEPELITSASILALVVGLCAALAMPLHLFSAVLSGLQRYGVMSLGVLVPLLFRTVTLIVLLSRGYGLIAMGLVFGASEVAMRVLQYVFAKKFLPQVSLTLKRLDWRLLGEMLAYGINTFLYGMGVVVIYKASDLIIGVFLGTAEISQFTVTVAAIMLLSRLLQTFTAAIKPAVSDLDARGDIRRIREIAFLTQKYGLLLLIPSGCFLIVMGRDFLQIWVGHEFQNPAVVDGMSTILSVLTVGHCLRLAQHSNFVVLVGRGQHKIFGVLTFLMALLCVSASVISVRVFNWGLLGIAWSNSVPIGIISGVVLPIYYNLKMHISAMETIRRVWWPALLGSLPGIALINMWKYFAHPDSWLHISAVVIATVSVTLVSSWFLSYSKLERERFLKILIPCLSRNQ